MINILIQSEGDSFPVNRNTEINWKSVNLTRAITSRVDTLTFRLIFNEGKSNAYVPQNSDLVFVEEDGVIIFGGRIILNTETIEGGILIGMRISAKDFSVEMDSVRIARRWLDTNIQQVLQDIVDDILPPGFTLETDVDQDTTAIAFNYELPTKAIQQLAKIVNYDWYVDENRVIKFFKKKSEASPFSLSDTGENYTFDSLNFDRDITNIRNVVTIIGGKYPATERTDEQNTDGIKQVYLLPFSYKTINVELQSIPLVVGIANVIEDIDNPNVDVLYNKKQQTLEFKTIPIPEQNLSITGKPLLPIIIQVEDTASVASFGRFEHKIVDKNIESRGLAIKRAEAEIESWGKEQNGGSFTTQTIGLMPGQKINIQSDIREINETVLISRVRSKTITPTKFEHTITFATSEIFGMLEFLQNLLIAQDKDLEINFNEDIEKISIRRDKLNISDRFEVRQDTRTDFRYSPTAPEYVAKWNFSVWGGRPEIIIDFEFMNGDSFDFTDGVVYNYSTSYYED